MVWENKSEGGDDLMGIKNVKASLSGNEKSLEKYENDKYERRMKAPNVSGKYAVQIRAEDDAGNVMILDDSQEPSLMLYVSLWKDPKTNWKITDKFNISDYNRIKNNLLYLREKAITLTKYFEIEDMGEDILEYTELWSVNTFNLFEKNLDIINENTYQEDYGIRQVFYENGKFIQWDELNRIESAMFRINDLLIRQQQGGRRIPFKLGRFKEVRT